MQCIHPMLLKKESIWVPCGKCRACRIARSREWYVRLYHENVYYKESLFVTLTYNDENLKGNEQLNKSEMQNYIKRLRHQLDDTSIKYYASAEYGDKYKRPHYHLIIFGLGMKDHEIKKIWDARTKKWTNIAASGPLANAWQKGNVILGTVTKNSMRYVTDYIHKKLYGQAKKEDGKEQPFSLCSQGLGKRYALDNANYFEQKLGCTVYGIEMGMPRYYVKILKLEEKMKLQGLMQGVIKDVEMEEKYGMHVAKIQADSRKQKDKNLKAREELFTKGNL